MGQVKLDMWMLNEIEVEDHVEVWCWTPQQKMGGDHDEVGNGDGVQGDSAALGPGLG